MAPSEAGRISPPADVFATRGALRPIIDAVGVPPDEARAFRRKIFALVLLNLVGLVFTVISAAVNLLTRSCP